MFDSLIRTWFTWSKAATWEFEDRISYLQQQQVWMFEQLNLVQEKFRV